MKLTDTGLVDAVDMRGGAMILSAPSRLNARRPVYGAGGTSLTIPPGALVRLGGKLYSMNQSGPFRLMPRAARRPGSLFLALDLPL